MKKMILLILTMTNVAFADVLLVAHKNTSLSDYKKICQKNGYVCLPERFSHLQTKKITHFDRLIETFDLDSKNYVAEFSKILSQSLKEDDLNLDQIRNLILAAEKLNQTKSLNLNEKILKLKKLQSILENFENESSDKIIYIAGISVANTLQNQKKLDPFLNEIKHAKIDYISYTENGERKYFLNGDCDHPRYTELVSQFDMPVIPHFSEGCNLSQKYNWGSDLMIDHFKSQKKSYLIGLAVVTSAFLLKSYEISIADQ